MAHALLRAAFTLHVNALSPDLPASYCLYLRTTLRPPTRPEFLLLVPCCSQATNAYDAMCTPSTLFMRYFLTT